MMTAFALMVASSLAVAADCPEATQVADLRDAVSAVKEAWRQQDPDRVDAAAVEATTAVECVSTPLSEEDVAAFFRVRGFAEFVAGDVVAAELSLLAARRIQPRYRLPEELLVDSHPMRKMYDTLAYRAIAEPTMLERPAEGELIVDGTREATSVPSERPFVFQRLDREGAVVETLIAAPGQIPQYIEYSPPVFVDVVQPDPVPRKPPISRPLLVAGVSATAVGVGGMLASAQSQKAWKSSKECAPIGACPGMIRFNQTVGKGGIAVAAAGAALGIGAVAVGRW